VIKDLTGQRFGRLIALENVGFTKNRNAIWKCICDCGKTKDIVSGNLKAGTTTSCGCFRLEVSGTYNRLPDGESAFNILYDAYKKKAFERNYCFELTKDQFRELTKGNCYYCGVEPKQKKKTNKKTGYYIFNGIDRANNSLGYTIENSVSCCYVCNRMKMEFSNEEFLNHIERIYKHCKNTN
jgi:hypothetical protein